MKLTIAISKKHEPHFFLANQNKAEDTMKHKSKYYDKVDQRQLTIEISVYSNSFHW